MPPMRSGKGTILMGAGLVLVLAAFGLTGYNIQDETRAGDAAEETVSVLKTEIVPVSEQNLPERMIPDYILNPKMELPVQEVDGLRYVGYLSIPALELELPVMEEWSYPNLKLAPCRYTGTPYQGPMVIAAHNYDRHFGRIKELLPDDLVEFTDVDGNTFQYTVAALEQLEPTQTADMVSTDWDLTLFTCTLGGQYRVTVRCLRAENGG